MDRNDTQSGRLSPAPRNDRRPSQAINQTTNQADLQSPNATPKSPPTRRATHHQLPRIQTNLPTTFQQPVEVGKLRNPPTTIQQAAAQTAPHKLVTLTGAQPTTVQEAVQLKLAKLSPSRRGLERTAELDVLMDRLRYVVVPESDTEAKLPRRDPREVRMFWKAVRNGVRVQDEEVWKGVWDGVEWSVSP